MADKLQKIFLKKEGITLMAGVAFEEVTGDRIKLIDGTGVPFRYAMVVPPFAGQDVVQAKRGLSDEKGYFPVEDTYQSKAYPAIYAAGSPLCRALADGGAERDPQDRLPH